MNVKTHLFVRKLVISKFNYCLSIWMFHNTILINRINRIHKRALRLVVYQNNNVPFSELLELDNPVTIHQRNLHVLLTEIFKAKIN